MQAQSRIQRQRFNTAEQTFTAQLAKVISIGSSSAFQHIFGFEPSVKFSFEAVFGREIALVCQELARAQVDCIALSGGDDSSERNLETNLGVFVTKTEKTWASYKASLLRYQSGHAEVDLHSKCYFLRLLLNSTLMELLFFTRNGSRACVLSSRSRTLRQLRRVAGIALWDYT